MKYTIKKVVPGTYGSYIVTKKGWGVFNEAGKLFTSTNTKKACQNYIEFLIELDSHKNH